MWNLATPNLTIGDLVIVREKNHPPSSWPLARVIIEVKNKRNIYIVEVHPGKDGLVRVVTIQTPMGVYTRPITKIALLPATKENDLRHFFLCFNNL